MDVIKPYNSDADGNIIKNIYDFTSPAETLISRLRRVEKTVPYLVRGNSVVSTAKVQGVNSSALGSGNVLDLASSSVTKVGSVSPAGVTGQFAAVTSTTTITWYWDGTNGSTPCVIHRADGSTFAVPRGSITISGLTAATTYYFLPFWSVYSPCAVGWVQGTVGSPKIAFVLADTTNPASSQYYQAQQLLQNREPLATSFMTQSTTAAGTGGGTAGGGGSGGFCVMAGTDIEPIGDYGDMKIGIHHEYVWRTLATMKGKWFNGTLNHPVYVARKDQLPEIEKILQDGFNEETLAPFKRELRQAAVSHYIVTRDGMEEIGRNYYFTRNCTKRSVHMDKGHLFFANGILSHNAKAPYF